MSGYYTDLDNDRGIDQEVAEYMLERTIDDMTKRYAEGASAEVGATIECSGCGRRIVKKSYQSKFCSNKGKSNCKDKFWNTVDDSRRNRAMGFK